MTDTTPPPVITPTASGTRRSRGLWWKIPLAALAALVLLVIAFALSFDEIVRRVVRSRIETTTGLPTEIAKFDVQPSVPAVHIVGFRMNNTAEFGGQTFLSIPELFVSVDREAFREGKLRLMLARLNIDEVNVVVNQQGKTNLNELRLQVEQEQERAKASGKDTTGREQPEFAGVDRFELKLNTIRYTDLRDPDYSRSVNLGLTNIIVENAKTLDDLKFKLGAQFVFAALLNGIDVLSVFQGGLENLPRQDDKR